MDIKDNNLDNIQYIKSIINVSKTVEESKDLDYWDNIPMSHHEYSILYALWNFKCKRILDIGCGAGNVLRYAKNIGFETTGIDFQDFSPYNLNHTFIHKDLRELDPSFYSQYDIIYIAMPLKIGQGFEELIDLIKDNIKVGQYIITPLFIIEDPRFKRICSNTFCKIL
jgi:hypothetical protein